MNKKTKKDPVRTAYMLRNTPLDPPVKGGSAKAKRTAARMAITQIIYQIEISQKDTSSEMADFMAHRAGYEFDGLQLVPPDEDMVERIIPGVYSRLEDLDSMITAALKPSQEIEITKFKQPNKFKKYEMEKGDNADSDSDAETNTEIISEPEEPEEPTEPTEAEKAALLAEEQKKQLATQERREKRLGVLLRSILRAAIYELLAETSIDEKVIVSDYLSVTAAFYDKGEVALINGILDKISRQLRG